MYFRFVERFALPLFCVLITLPGLSVAQSADTLDVSAEDDFYHVRLNCTPDGFFIQQRPAHFNLNQPYQLSNFGAQTDFNRKLVRQWRWGRVKLYRDSAKTERYKFRDFKREFPQYKRLKKRRFWRKPDTTLALLQIEIVRSLSFGFQPSIVTMKDHGYQLGIHTYDPPESGPPNDRQLLLYPDEDDLMRVAEALEVRRFYDGIEEHGPVRILETLAGTFSVEDCQGCEAEAFIAAYNASPAARGTLLFSKPQPNRQTKAPVWYRTPFEFKDETYGDEPLVGQLVTQHNASVDELEMLEQQVALPLFRQLVRGKLKVYRSEALDDEMPLELIHDYVERHPDVPVRPNAANLKNSDFSIGLRDIEIGGRLKRVVKDDGSFSTQFLPEYIALGWNAYGYSTASVSLGIMKLKDAEKLVPKVDGQPLREWLTGLNVLAYPVQVNSSYPGSASGAVILNQYLLYGGWDDMPPPEAIFELSPTQMLNLYLELQAFVKQQQR